MAKLNVELNIDWLDEDESLDDVIKENLINSVTNRIYEKISKEIEKRATDEVLSKISDCIDTKVNEVADNLLNREITIYDKWGDIKEKDVSVIDMFKKRMDNFLDEKVNSRGLAQGDGYDRKKTRLQYLIDQTLDYDMKSKVDDAAREVSKKLKTYIDETLKKQIGENVAKVIGLDNITNGIAK